MAMLGLERRMVLVPLTSSRMSMGMENVVVLAAPATRLVVWKVASWVGLPLSWYCRVEPAGTEL